MIYPYIGHSASVQSAWDKVTQDVSISQFCIFRCEILGWNTGAGHKSWKEVFVLFSLIFKVLSSSSLKLSSTTFSKINLESDEFDNSLLRKFFNLAGTVPLGPGSEEGVILPKLSTLPEIVPLGPGSGKGVLLRKLFNLHRAVPLGPAKGVICSAVVFYQSS